MEGKNMTINISTSTIFKSLLIILFFVAVYWVRDIVLVVLTAVTIASAIEPGTKWLVVRKIPRVLAVLFIYAAVIILVFGLLYFLVPSIITETVSLLENFPQYIRVTELWAPLGNVGDSLNLPHTIDVNELIGKATKTLIGISGSPFQTAINFLGGVVSFILIGAISFYLAVKEDGVEQFLLLIVPIKNENYVINLWKRTQVKIGRWLQGQLILQVIVAVLVYFGLVILQIPHALLLAVLAFVFEIIPVFGMTMAAIPAVLLAFANGGVSSGVLVAVLYIVVQQFESNLIYPLVVKKIIGVPPLLVIISLIIGGKLAGFLGIILSVPLSVALMEFFDDVDKKKIEARHHITEK